MKKLLLLLLLLICTSCDSGTFEIQKIVGFGIENYSETVPVNGVGINSNGGVSVVSGSASRAATRDVFIVYLKNGKLKKINTEDIVFHFDESLYRSYIVLNIFTADHIYIKGKYNDYIR